MTLDQIRKIVEKGESSTVEFKKSTALLKAAFNSICAFLNGDGGIVLIGVTDSGKITGQEVSDKTRREIAQEIFELEPSAQAQISVSYVSVNNKNKIIVIKVESGPHKPYIYDGRPYHRVQSTSPRMPQHRYEQLIIERGQLDHSWEDFPAHGSSIEDLDHDLFWSIINEATRAKRLPATAIREDIKQVMHSLNLIDDNAQITNAAMVLFGKSLFNKYMQCSMKMARFQGLDTREFLDNNLVCGNIFELLDKAELFIKKHLPVASKIVAGNFQRVEIPLIPDEALREAILNSLCHSDYSVLNGSISLAIFDNRMSITNEGGLTAGVTMEKIKHGYSRPRNKHIADVLYRCKYVEKWGRGIINIIKACKQANVPEPEFASDNLTFKVTFVFPKSLSTKLTTLEERFSSLTKRQKEIIKILIESGALPLKEISSKLTQPPAARTLRDEMAKLKRLKLVTSIGQTKNTIWSITEITRTPQ